MQRYPAIYGCKEGKGVKEKSAISRSLGLLHLLLHPVQQEAPDRCHVRRESAQLIVRNQRIQQVEGVHVSCLLE